MMTREQFLALTPEERLDYITSQVANSPSASEKGKSTTALLDQLNRDMLATVQRYLTVVPDDMSVLAFLSVFEGVLSYHIKVMRDISLQEIPDDKVDKARHIVDITSSIIVNSMFDNQATVDTLLQVLTDELPADVNLDLNDRD